MIRLVFFLLLFAFTAVYPFGQTVSNVDAYQEGTNIIITFDTNNDGCVDSVYCSTDGGRTWGTALRNVTGDVHHQMQAGSHRIVWDVLAERENLRGDKICFKVLHDTLKVFGYVEQMPEFPGGDAALMKYICSHMQYPPMAQEQGIQGKCFVQFVVTKTGSVGEVKVVRSLSPDCDNEVKRVVLSLPRFTPGKQNGHPVNVWYAVPVSFRLQENNDSINEKSQKSLKPIKSNKKR